MTEIKKTAKKDEIYDALQQEKENNKKLEKAIEDQQKTFEEQMGQMMQLIESLKVDKQEVEVESNKNSVTEEYQKEIAPNKRVQMISMLHGGTTLSSSRSRTRFNKFGEKRFAKYEDVEEYRYNFNQKLFEEMGIFIPDKDVRVALGLQEVYDDIDFSFNEFNGMLKLSKEDLAEKLKTLPVNLAVSFATFFIDKVKDSEVVDVHLIRVVEAHFNIKVNELLDRMAI